MKKEGKIWGSNILLFQNNNIQVNQIYIKKGGRCSKHLHQYKNNIFFIQSGRLLIEKWNNSGLIDSTILIDEQMTEIKNGINHRFTALEETHALEIYYPNAVDEFDIIRQDEGTVI
jgi:mannose-6-phosphate isomerase-like protein (cupin superfamily)